MFHPLSYPPFPPFPFSLPKIVFSMVVAVTTQLAIAWGAYATFGVGVEDDLLEIYPETGLITVARVCVSFLVTSCYPLQVCVYYCKLVWNCGRGSVCWCVKVCVFLCGSAGECECECVHPSMKCVKQCPSVKKMGMRNPLPPLSLDCSFYCRVVLAPSCLSLSKQVNYTPSPMPPIPGSGPSQPALRPLHLEGVRRKHAGGLRGTVDERQRR